VIPDSGKRVMRRWGNAELFCAVERSDRKRAFVLDARGAGAVEPPIISHSADWGYSKPTPGTENLSTLYWWVCVGPISGSSELSMVRSSPVGSPSIGGKLDSQPIMIKILEPVGQPADLFDDQVDGFGAAIADAVSVEVGQHLGSPGAEGAAEAGDSGIGQVWKLSSTLIAISRPLAGVAW
jgi:hypothetical protein